MASMQIRPSTVDDAEAVVALVREVYPLVTLTADSWRHRNETTPPRARLQTLAAEVDGVFAGRSEAGLNFLATGRPSAYVGIAVHERFRRRGIGAVLLERAEAHIATLGAPRILSSFFESEAGVRFARAHGFHQVRAEWWSVADPRELTLEPAAPVRPAAEVDPRVLHHIDEAATRDMPYTDDIDEIPYEEWLGHVWRHPLFVREGSFVAYADDGEPAAVSFLIADRASGRATSMFTGTLSDYRGRGLAVAAKVAAMRWAAANGITQVATTNDDTNAPMLAVNAKVGFRPAGRNVEYLRESDRGER